ncbi:hypothetical protein LAB1_10630 [Roseibium sp. LAB1]
MACTDVFRRVDFAEEARQQAREILGLSKPEKKMNVKPRTDGWSGVRLQNGANPFDVKRPDLKKQAEMLDRNPAVARKLILAAGRDPELFLV